MRAEKYKCERYRFKARKTSVKYLGYNMDLQIAQKAAQRERIEKILSGGRNGSKKDKEIRKSTIKR
jgi:hypothetical protein